MRWQDGYSPLMVAASSGRYNAGQLLIQAKCNLEFADAVRSEVGGS